MLDIFQLVKYKYSENYIEFLLECNLNINEVFVDKISSKKYELIKKKCYEVLELPERLPKFNDDGFKPIHIAIKHNNLTAVKVFLKHNISINNPTENIKIYGIYKSNFDITYSYQSILSEMHSSTNNPFVYSFESLTPIHISAIYNKDVTVMEYLLKNGANIEEKNSLGYSPLLLASIFNPSLEMMEFLLKNCSESINVEVNGKTPLTWAVKYNSNIDVIKVMLENNCKGNNLFILAINNSNTIPIFKLLREFNIDINEENEFNETVFDCCIRENRTKELRSLIKMDIQPKVRYIIELLREKNIEDLQYWQSNGLDLNLQDENENTAIHYLAKYFFYKEFIYLIHLGADYNRSKQDKKTPMQIIDANGMAQMIKEIYSLRSFI